jgi:hypothetical protein
MTTQKIYFVSDIHLGNRYLDDYRIAEKMAVEWMDKIKHDAKATDNTK